MKPCALPPALPADLPDALCHGLLCTLEPLLCGRGVTTVLDGGRLGPSRALASARPLSAIATVIRGVRGLPSDDLAVRALAGGVGTCPAMPARPATGKLRRCESGVSSLGAGAAAALCGRCDCCSISALFFSNSCL